MTATHAFDAIVAGFDDQLRCEMATLAGSQCRRPAHWLIDVHGCQRALLCGHHARRWERRTRAGLCIDGAIRCPDCGCVFSRLENVARIAGPL